MRKNFHFCWNSLLSFNAAAIYFSISIFSCTYEMKSLKTNIVLFSTLIYRNLPSIMRWLRVNWCIQGRVIPNNISGLERYKLALLTVEYQFWKRRCLWAANTQTTYVWLSQGQDGEATFSFCIIYCLLLKCCV